MPALSTRHCAACGVERPFETPPCVDGHGELCPELACVDCGAAILLDPPMTWPPASRPPVSWPLERPPMLPARAA